MNRTEIEDKIIEVVAEATVNGDSPARRMLGSLGISNPVLEYLVGAGISAFSRDKRAEERLRFKVLQLDPSHYEKIRAAVEERERIRDASPSGQRARQRQLEMESQVRARREKIFADFKESADKLNAAMSFYQRWHLSDGTPLGLSKKTGLLAEAAREEAVASGHQRNVVFYRGLAARLTGEQTVQDAIPLDEAHKIREKAFNTEAGPVVQAA
jgi:hypothetical protein